MYHAGLGIKILAFQTMLPNNNITIATKKKIIQFSFMFIQKAQRYF